MTATAHEDALRRYYRWHARVYDQTRWSFLFGRHALLREASMAIRPRCIWEIGCGTGVNLHRLAKLHPHAHLTGLDGSTAMLSVARRRLLGMAGRVRLQLGFYEAPLSPDPAPDLIVISYCLSMIHPNWQAAIDAAVLDLAPGGCLAVVDFHGSPWRWFRKWMGLHHVRLEQELAPHLAARLPCHQLRIRPAFGGLWRYFQFLGFKGAPPSPAAPPAGTPAGQRMAELCPG